MAKEKKLVEAITPMDKDFAQWYTDVVTKAELISYSNVRGCMIIRPRGYAIWENIQKQLDARFKETGVDNVYLPMLIPESLLQKEKDHVEGFAPEVAWVTHGGEEKLSERLCIRPTSETLFCDHVKDIVHSYRDLPVVYNQWCSVLRWEKTTRPFLRSSEFLWQEGHTFHATAEEAKERTEQMLNVYADFCENVLALSPVYETSWGMSTRIIGAIIMVHGDDSGLVLPPRIAPVQTMIIPIQQKKEGVLDKAFEIRDMLKSNFSVKVDDSDKSPGWKFSEQEIQGIPTRIEIGPKDIEKGQAVIVRRDTREKIVTPIEKIEETLAEVLETMQNDMYNKAKAHLEKNTHIAHNWEEFNDILENQQGFIRAMWCGERECEEAIKDENGATTRCIPFVQAKHSDVCVHCGKPAKCEVYFGKAY